MESPETCADYLKAFARPGSWGGDMELAAAAASYDIPILIYKNDLPTQLFNRPGKGKPVCLFFSSGHYEWKVLLVL